MNVNKAIKDLSKQPPTLLGVRRKTISNEVTQSLLAALLSAGNLIFGIKNNLFGLSQPNGKDIKYEEKERKKTNLFFAILHLNVKYDAGF